MFPGRVILGIGTGESLNEVPPRWGSRGLSKKERTARLREALTLIRTLWRDERVTFQGEFYRTHAATIYDRPAELVPIFIAGAGPFMAKLAGLEGEGFICTSGKQQSLYTDTLLPSLAAGLQSSKRVRSAQFERMIEVKVSFDTDPDRAMRDTRNWRALALSPEEKKNVEDPRELERLAAGLPLERTASRWIVSTDPQEMLEKIGAYVRLGFDHLVFHSPTQAQPRFLDLFSREVLPRLRAKFA
jgi:coenzyme F420-dependent glucose-6-phosphate dehydrogenase